MVANTLPIQRDWEYMTGKKLGLFDAIDEKSMRIAKSIDWENDKAVYNARVFPRICQPGLRGRWRYVNGRKLKLYRLPRTRLWVGQDGALYTYELGSNVFVRAALWQRSEEGLRRLHAKLGRILAERTY